MFVVEPVAMSMDDVWPGGAVPETGAEDLSDVQRRPDPAIGRMRLRSGAVKHLLRPSGLQGWTDERGSDRELLIEQGWTTVDGDPTSAAVALHRELRDQGDVLHLTAVDSRGVVRGQIHCGVERAVVVVSTTRRSVSQLPSAVPAPGEADLGDVEVDVVPLSAVPLLLARWGGLTPAWTVGDRLAPLAADVVRRRVLDPQQPLPDGADDDLVELWQRPWTWWTVATAGREVDLEFINAADRGQLVPRDKTDGSLRLVARPGSLVWGDLQQVCGRLPSRAASAW